jgi:hypothetical protein
MPLDFSAGAQPESNARVTPGSLKLEFSKAADYDRIQALFEPVTLRQIDPQGFVVKRLDADFRAAIAVGSAGFLSDKKGDIQTLTIAYHTFINENRAPTQTHDYTEFGTGLSRIPGFNSAQLVMAALAIHEWWAYPPAEKIFNEINNTNLPSVKTYRDHLAWEEITDQKEIDTLFDCCYRNVAQDCGAGIGKPPPPEHRVNESFYVLTDKALATHARILLEFMKQGGLLNKRTQDKIPVDFSVLDDLGLTRSRLEALAAGQTSREQLRQMPGFTPS